MKEYLLCFHTYSWSPPYYSFRIRANYLGTLSWLYRNFLEEPSSSPRKSLSLREEHAAEMRTGAQDSHGPRHGIAARKPLCVLATRGGAFEKGIKSM